VIPSKKQSRGEYDMMGRLFDRQQPFFYDFCLEDHVPQDHLLRQIAKVLDLSDVREKLAPYYSSKGRPSLDPELMIRRLLIGYLYGIRSERRLVEEVHLNLAYRWFCGLGLTGEVPERSSFSKTRHGRVRESDAFRMVFESVLQTCLRAGLIGGETFATDASVIEADARIARCTEGKQPPDDWDDPGKVTRPVLAQPPKTRFSARRTRSRGRRSVQKTGQAPLGGAFPKPPFSPEFKTFETAILGRKSSGFERQAEMSACPFGSGSRRGAPRATMYRGQPVTILHAHHEAADAARC